MNSECYWCVAGAGSIVATTGNAGDPFACCKRCQVFVCGHHGERDHPGQQFFCFDCNKSIALASAITLSLADVDDDVKDELQIETLLTEGLRLFKSWADYKRKNPGKQLLFEQAENSHIDFETWPGGKTKTTLMKLTGDARKLLMVAAVIVYTAYENSSYLLQEGTIDYNLFHGIRIQTREHGFQV
jgi:hypothetical protein